MALAEQYVTERGRQGHVLLQDLIALQEDAEATAPDPEQGQSASDLADQLAEQARTAAEALPEAYNALAQGAADVHRLDAGAQQVASGADKLAAATGTARSGADDLAGGVTRYTDGVGTARSGAQELAAAFTMKEQDMVEEFTNGRVGMMVDSLAHLTMIRESNPDLKFSISALPAEDGYDGKRGIPYASWAPGVSESSDHKEEAWKLFEFLMSEDANAELASMAKAFPGNVASAPTAIRN